MQINSNLILINHIKHNRVLVQQVELNLAHQIEEKEKKHVIIIYQLQKKCHQINGHPHEIVQKGHSATANSKI